MAVDGRSPPLGGVRRSYLYEHVRVRGGVGWPVPVRGTCAFVAYSSMTGASSQGRPWPRRRVRNLRSRRCAEPIPVHGLNLATAFRPGQLRCTRGTWARSASPHHARVHFFVDTERARADNCLPDESRGSSMQMFGKVVLAARGGGAEGLERTRPGTAGDERPHPNERGGIHRIPGASPGAVISV